MKKDKIVILFYRFDKRRKDHEWKFENPETGRYSYISRWVINDLNFKIINNLLISLAEFKKFEVKPKKNKIWNKKNKKLMTKKK